MSLTLRDEAKAAPDGGRRLLLGLSGGAADPGLQTHLDRWGELRLRGSRLIDELDGAGLVGHGGAWFPVSTKWKSVASASRRRPVVVANGAESEPASRKDALLLSHAPHLVLDGLALAADALGAHQAIVYVPAASIPVVEAAIGERKARRLDRIGIEIAEAPDAFLAGQESAVVNALSGRRVAVPSFVALTPIRERGVGGRPTLVQNVETLAHVALIARFGATWFRQVGSPENPGTMLLTVNAHGGPTIVEAVLGSSLRLATGISAEELARARGVLLGGYGGGWVSPKVFSEPGGLRKGGPEGRYNPRCRRGRPAARGRLPVGGNGGRRALHAGAGRGAVRPLCPRPGRAGGHPGATGLRRGGRTWQRSHPRDL